MRSSVALVIFRLAIAVALAVSAALLIDYLRPLPAFCDGEGGCGAVRASTMGRIGPLMPAVGLGGFASLMALSLMPEGRLSRLLLPLTALGGLAAAALLLVQAFVIGAFCQLCVVVDVSAIVATGALLLHARAPLVPTSASPAMERWLWGSASVLSILVPVAIGLVQPSPPVPREILELWKPGKLNVVEMSDFQCPFCRKLHPAMAKVLADYGDKVHVVRLNMPLKSHPQARDAARAYVCADRQGKGETMADALFESRDLTAENCEKLAEQIGLSLPDFRACVADAATEARIEAEIARVRASGFQGLPTVWIGSERLRGFQSEKRLREAFERAAADTGHRGLASENILWGALAAGVAGIGIVALRMGRKA